MATRARFLLETYASGRNGRWYWRIRSRANGKTIMDSAGGKQQGYASRRNIRRALLRFPFNWRDIDWS